jgi:hypothetical protein
MAAKQRLLTLDSLDQRTTAAARARALRDKVIAERGGVELDALKQAHASTWAVLSQQIEDGLARLLKGEPVDVPVLVSLINARRREGESLGVPEPRDVTPSLHEYLRSKQAEKTAPTIDNEND